MDEKLLHGDTLCAKLVKFYSTTDCPKINKLCA